MRDTKTADPRTINGRTFEIRALTRGEIKDLSDYGFTYLGCPIVPDQAVEVQDKILAMQLSADDITFLDQCSNRQVTDLWIEIMKETYGDPDETKNLSGTSDGTQIKKE